ncbi:MAG TPA: signal peptidase II [Candidatus Angelobacter sp.]|nr:signal peptidase II [Candidatus Angelobacter sp.]
MRHLLIALVVLILDRITKLLVINNIVLDDAVSIIPGFFRLTHLENPGAAFSLFAESPSPFKTALLVAISVAALAVVGLLLWMRRNAFNATTVALSLILGGALGNLWDRLSDGKVTDFLDFYVGLHHWPPFNLADSAIVVGALLLMIQMLRKDRHAPAQG